MSEDTEDDKQRKIKENCRKKIPCSECDGTYEKITFGKRRTIQ